MESWSYLQKIRRWIDFFKRDHEGFYLHLWRRSSRPSCALFSWQHAASVDSVLGCVHVLQNKGVSDTWSHSRLIVENIRLISLRPSLSCICFSLKCWIFFFLHYIFQARHNCMLFNFTFNNRLKVISYCLCFWKRTNGTNQPQILFFMKHRTQFIICS